MRALPRAQRLVAEQQGAVQDDDQVLVRLAQRQQRTAAPQVQGGPEQRGVLTGSRCGVTELTDEDRGGRVAELDLRELLVVLEISRAGPGGVGLRHPELDAVQLPAARRTPLATRETPRRLLRVDDPAACRHEVELTGP